MTLIIFQLSGTKSSVCTCEKEIKEREVRGEENCNLGEGNQVKSVQIHVTLLATSYYSRQLSYNIQFSSLHADLFHCICFGK